MHGASGEVADRVGRGAVKDCCRVSSKHGLDQREKMKRFSRTGNNPQTGYADAFPVR